MGKKSCLIIIDVQKGVFSLKQPIHHAEKIIENIGRLIKAAGKKRLKIIYTRHENGTFLETGSKGWELIDDIKPDGGDALIVPKRHAGIFHDTDVLQFLKEENILKIYLAGLISNGCIKDSCLDGLKHGFEVTLISDAHSTFYKNADKIIADINEELKRRGVILITCREFEE